MAGREELRKILSWDADQKVFNHFEWVWLKACYDENGKRIGITDCCEVISPCAWHKSLDLANTKEHKA